MFRPTLSTSDFMAPPVKSPTKAPAKSPGKAPARKVAGPIAASPKSAAAQALGPKTLASANLESYDVVELHRSELVGAPYNPRQLTDNQKRKLKAGLKRHGLVSPPTWNRRSGYIVGGHQRIAIMDSLMGTDDYTLRVAAIDVDSGREKELNVLLNNTMAQGQWDIGLLDDLLKDAEVNIDGTGFELADVYQMLGTSPFEQRQEEAAKMAEQLASVSELYDTIRDRNRQKEQSEFYLVFVFRTEDQALRFLDAGKGTWDANRYQSGELLAQQLGYDLSAPPADD